MISNNVVGITGAGGFIGSHCAERLKRTANYSIVEVHQADFESVEKLSHALSSCSAVVHCAGINRSDQGDVFKITILLAQQLVDALKTLPSVRHVVFTSSTQVDSSTEYGNAKKQAATILAAWAKDTGSSFSNLIIPNVFGDHSRPFYNSVVATFCHQLTHGQVPTIKEDREMEFVHVNDVTSVIVQELLNSPSGITQKRIPGTIRRSVSSLHTILNRFKESYNDKRVIPALNDQFERELFSVYLSYFEYSDIIHAPPVHTDDRGSLIELIKLENGGQVFFSTTKPGFVRGNHYHTTKIERFCVIQGSAQIKLRRIGTNKIITYDIHEEEKRFVEIPVFHTHSIKNTGSNDLITIFWTNELFDPENGDTFFEEVEKGE